MKKIMSLMLILSMILSLTACSGSAEETAAATETEAVETEAAETEAAASDDAKYAVILKTTTTTFWKNMYDGIAAYIESEKLNADLYTATNDSDDAGQLAIVENCINSGEYAGIALAPCNSTTLVSAVKLANEAGIPVVNIDERFNVEEMNAQGAACVGFVSSDNQSIGNMGASYVASLIEEGSQVAIVEGIAGNTSSEERKAGATKGFEEAGMDIIASVACNWDMQTAMDTVATWCLQYPDLKAIYCCNDGMAAGARQAVAASGLDIKVCGTDGDADAIEAVAGQAADGVSMTATVAQDPAAIGVACLKLLVEAVADPEAYPASAEPEKTAVDAILVTVDNAKDFIE